MTRYAPYGVEIQPDGDVSATLIGGVTEQSIDTGTEVNAEVTAGATAPQYGEISAAQSAGSFVTADLATTLGKLGTRGACLTGGATPGFALYKLQKEPCGDLAAGAVHGKSTIGNGRIVPRTLSASHGSRATLSCEVFSLFDGTNLPLIPTETVALPTGLDDNFGFHLGAVQVAGITLNRNTQVSIDFGVTITPETDDGELYAKSLHIATVQPVITITTHDVLKFGVGAGKIPLTGLNAVHADTSIVLRRRVLGTGAFSTGSDHIEITASGVLAVRETSASGNNPHAMTVVLTTLDDGTNDNLVLDLAHSLT